MSSICDNTGDLLFYTDGLTIWNSNNVVLKRYKDWWPWSKNVMPLIIPYVSNDSLYYLFGIDNLDDPDRESYKLQYVSIKMKNAGDIEEAVYPRPQSASSFYTTLLSNTSHVVAATAHCNGTDIWITTHSPGSLDSYLVTATGVNPVPVITPIPDNIIPSRKLKTGYSNIKFAANGEKLIVPDDNKIIVFDFDNQTGKFENPLVLTIPQGQTLEDAEISADGSKLYFGSYEITDPDVLAEIHYLYQMNLEASSNAQIQQSLFKLNDGDVAICFRSCHVLHRTMQLGPDGKIYIIRSYGTVSPYGTEDPLGKTLDVINEPAKPGIDADYVQAFIQLDNVPKAINYNYVRSTSYTKSPSSIQYQKANCTDQPVKFTLIYKKIDSVKWDFGDKLSNSLNYSSSYAPSHLFSSPGSFIVRAIVYNRCIIDTISSQVVMISAKSVKIPSSIRDTLICSGDELALNVSSPLANGYKWENGSVAPMRTISKDGIYSISISNDCSVDRKSFKVTSKVCPCNFSIPNAFTPNMDGLNEIYRPVFDCHPSPEAYQFRIYNRFGQIVFESNKPNLGWDGTQNHLPSSTGVYVWTLRYKRPGIKGTITKKGTVTLVK
ncbi:MAG: gliding motility-associated C-terminal domain-containing protein [Ginsengibacter sp.]